MEEQKNEEVVQETVQEVINTKEIDGRPTFLTVLCILTFIGSGLGVLGSILLFVGAGAVMSYFGTMSGAEGAGGMGYVIGLLILSGTSLFGAIQMWNLKKIGFYIYTGVGIIGIILPLLFGMGFSTLGTIITIAFIVMYYLNVKYMS